MSSSSHLSYPHVPVVPALLITTSTAPPLARTKKRVVPYKIVHRSNAPNGRSRTAAAQEAMDASSATSSVVTASRASPKLSRSARRSTQDVASRDVAITALDGCFARICETNSRPMPRFAPVTTTTAFLISSPGTYVASDAAAAADASRFARSGGIGVDDARRVGRGSGSATLDDDGRSARRRRGARATTEGRDAEDASDIDERRASGTRRRRAGRVDDARG
eukprot:30715-Pelagococcus_subviridis.AAC.3